MNNHHHHHSLSLPEEHRESSSTRHLTGFLANVWVWPASFAASSMVSREDKRTDNRTVIPALKNNGAAGYQGPVKIELLKSACLLGATCTICNVLHGWSREQKNKQQNNVPNPTKQCSCRLSGSSENRAFEGCRSTECFGSVPWAVHSFRLFQHGAPPVVLGASPLVGSVFMNITGSETYIISLGETDNFRDNSNRILYAKWLISDERPDRRRALGFLFSEYAYVIH